MSFVPILSVVVVVVVVGVLAERIWRTRRGVQTLLVHSYWWIGWSVMIMFGLEDTHMSVIGFLLQYLYFNPTTPGDTYSEAGSGGY